MFPLGDSTPEQLSWAAMASSMNRSSPTRLARYDGSDLPRMIRRIAFKARPRAGQHTLAPSPPCRPFGPKPKRVGAAFGQLVHRCPRVRRRPVVPCGKSAVWVEPELYCRVRFQQRTPNGVLRGASFRGLLAARRRWRQGVRDDGLFLSCHHWPALPDSVLCPSSPAAPVPRAKNLNCLLDTHSDQVLDQHPMGRGRGRPPRIASFAHRFKLPIVHRAAAGACSAGRRRAPARRPPTSLPR